MSTEALLNSRIGTARFKALMRVTAAGVHVITARYLDEMHGLTATAFSSVCADPPMVLIIVNRSSRTHDVITKSKRFVVNHLASNQRAIGDKFGQRLEDQFSEIEYTSGMAGPVLSGTAGFIECDVQSEHVFGTHTVFVANVLSGLSHEQEPLIYHDGSYRSLSPEYVSR